MLLIVTPLSAAALTVLYVRLALDVIKIRRREQISLGTEDNKALEQATRAHGNLTEWAPIGLILIAVLEINAAPFWLCAPPAIAFVVGRALHPKGLASTEPTVLKNRVLGMQLTIYACIALASLNILWLMYLFFAS